MLKKIVKDGFAVRDYVYTDGQSFFSYGYRREEMKDFKMLDSHKTGLFYEFSNRVSDCRKKYYTY